MEDLPRRSMVMVSSAFISSRRSRTIFKVSSASGRDFKTADFEAADLEGDLEGDLDTVTGTGFLAVRAAADLVEAEEATGDVVRDLSFPCPEGAESIRARFHPTHMVLMVSICQI